MRCARSGVGSIVLETDCPYLAPVPMRGKRNEPAFLTHVAAKVAEVLETSVSEIASATDRNADALFGLRAANDRSKAAGR